MGGFLTTKNLYRHVVHASVLCKYHCMNLFDHLCVATNITFFHLVPLWTSSTPGLMGSFNIILP